MTELLRLKRVYAPAVPEDGFRVLVDRLWPRGESKQKAALDLWDKDVAPSADLRRWFGHVPERFPEFADRYRAELADSPALETLVTTLSAHPVVTLLFGARDVVHNEAVVLAGVLGPRLKVASPSLVE